MVENPFEKIGKEEKIERLLPTEFLQRAFNNLTTETTFAEEATERKRNWILEIRKRKLINPEILKNNPTVYIASGTDVEFPILLGAQNIIMVDPIFEDKEKVNEVRRRIEAMIGNNELKISEEQINSKTKTIFEFTIEENNFRIEVIPAYYGLSKISERLSKIPLPRRLVEEVEEEEQKEETKEILEFQPPKEIGMILAFLSLGVFPDDDPETIKRLIPGGYILSTSNLYSFRIEGVEEPWELDLPEQIELQKEGYKKLGYEFIPLKCEEGINYAFLRKL
jgi:hypothetical protein